MLKKHLAVMLMFILAAGVFSQSIPSGSGRYNALGNSPFILDAHIDILNNPAWNSYYKDYAFADLSPFGGGEFTGHAGVNFGVSKKWSLGFIVNKRQDSWENFRTSSNTYIPGNIGSPIVPFMGLIGYQASKNFYISLAPYYASWNQKATLSDTVSADLDNSTSSLGANLGFMYLIKKGWIEGSFDFRMNKYKYDSTVGSYNAHLENDGGIEFGAKFRGWIYPAKNSKIALVPVIGFYTFSFQPKLTGTASATGLNYSWMNFGGAVGLNWPILDDIQIAGGIGANYNTFKSDSTNFEIKNNSFFAPTYSLALETKIADWLTGRMGFTRNVENYSSKFTGGTNTAEFTGTSPSSDASTFSMGTGFHFGRFSIDATISEAWFKHGINFVSGGDGNDLFGVVSASYNFAK
jgi:hypothetical protein